MSTQPTAAPTAPASDPDLLPQALDRDALETVMAGGSAPRTASNDDLLSTLNGLQTTLQTINKTASSTGFSTTEVLMLGLLLSQRPAVNVFVRHPFW
jgi:hypothetical protein